jgi:hypothetical protein
MTDGAASVSGTSASSFWSRKLQEGKSVPHDALTNSLSESEGVFANGNPPNGMISNGIPSKLKNGILTNDSITPKAALIHKTTATTLAQVKTGLSPAVELPRNCIVFKRKQLATVSVDSIGDDNINFLPDTKHVRIQQLEDEVAARDERIKTLVDEAHAKDIYVQQMQAGADFTTQKLSALAEEKDGRIAVLQARVEQESRLVQQLEKKVKALEDAASISKGKEPYAKYNRATHGSVDRLHLWLECSADPNSGQEPTPEIVPQVSVQEQNSPAQSAANDTMQKQSRPQYSESTLADFPTVTTVFLTRTPAPRDNKEPLFSTPETLKTGPPVPKAPLIVFPQKNMKKNSAPAPLFTASVAISAPGIIENAAKGAWVATGHLPDIRNLSRDQRENLGRGPKVTITVGGVPTPTMPKNMLMQVSEVANDYFTINPNAKVMPFPRGCMVGGAVCEFAKWINDICTAPKEFSVKIRFPDITKDADTQNLAIIQAARVLGMSTYVRHFTRHYCDEIRKALLPLDTIARIEQFTATDDPVYECLVNNMAHHWSKKNVADQQTLEQFLVAHPRLATDLEKANAKIQKKREVCNNALIVG